MSGTKETKEAVLAVLKLAPILVKQFKDGVQLGDASELYEKIMKNEEVKAAVLAGYDGYNLIPDEVKDLDLGESFDLVITILPEIQKLIEELKS